MDLTDRQTEAFRLAGEGLTLDEIAERMGNLHRSTVKAHLKHVQLKLGVEKKRGLVLAARDYFGDANGS